MDVPGRKSICEHGSEEFVVKSCKPCEDEGKYHTAADGLCQECEEIMCSTCFRHHKKWKFSKDHVLIDLKFTDSILKENSMSGEELEICQQHLKELIKFYCPTHEQVGCGDCMILEHKPCKVEYIPDKARNFKNSKDFETVVNDVQACNNQSQECLSSIQTNRDVADELHAKFIADAEAYRAEIVNHVDKLVADICKEATDIKSKSINNFEILEKNASDISQEISLMKETLQSQQDQPNKLFVTSVLIKQKLKSFKEKLDENRDNNGTTEYNFQQDDELKHTVMNFNYLGVINWLSGKDQNKGEGHDTSENETKQTTVNIPKAQPLWDRKLRVNNINIDGDYLSFSSGNLKGEYIGDIKMTVGCYFEVEIIRSGGSGGSIAIGLVPTKYPSIWRQWPVSYHSVDGRVIINVEKPIGLPCGDNDRMGIGVAQSSSGGVDVYVSKNGRQIGSRYLLIQETLYPIIALDKFGQKVKVILKANIPDGVQLRYENEW